MPHVHLHLHLRISQHTPSAPPRPPLLHPDVHITHSPAHLRSSVSRRTSPSLPHLTSPLQASLGFASHRDHDRPDQNTKTTFSSLTDATYTLSCTHTPSFGRIESWLRHGTGDESINARCTPSLPSRSPVGPDLLRQTASPASIYFPPSPRKQAQHNRASKRSSPHQARPPSFPAHLNFSASALSLSPSLSQPACSVTHDKHARPSASPRLDLARSETKGRSIKNRPLAHRQFSHPSSSSPPSFRLPWLSTILWSQQQARTPGAVQ